jgi:hypothetical protein
MNCEVGPVGDTGELVCEAQGCVAAEGLLLSSACPVKRLGEWDIVAGVDPDDSDLVSGGGGGEPPGAREVHNHTRKHRGVS